MPEKDSTPMPVESPEPRRDLRATLRGSHNFHSINATMVLLALSEWPKVENFIVHHPQTAYLIGQIATLFMVHYARKYLKSDEA